MTDINAVARRVQYSGNNPADAGPFNFTFQVNATTEVNVFVDGTKKTLSTHYTVSLSSSGAGSVSFTSGNFPTNTQTVTISSNVGLARSSVYTTGGPLTAAALEKDFDTQQMILQQVSQKVDRALAAPENDATNIDMTLPVKADRLGKYLAFNSSTGNPEIGPDTASVTALASITTAVNLLGTSAVVEDLGLLATSAVIEDMGLLATSANVTAMGLLGVSGVVTDMGILGTAAIVEDMGILGTSANVTAMGLLGTAAVVEDMGLLSASAVITDMDLLGTSANVTAMGVLGTSANVTAMAALSASAVVADMALLATTDVIADMALLANSDVISDLNTLATSDIVSDLNTLATSDIVSDINTLATSDIVSDLNTLATSDIVTDINLLATSAIVEDLNLLATSSVISDMAALAGSGANPNITSVTASGAITAASFVIGSADINENDLESIDGITAGTIAASKAAVVDANKNITGFNNITLTGELDAATLDISGAIDVAGNSVLASVDVTGVATAATFEPDGDTSAGDSAAIGYTAAEGLILTGQGSTSDITLKNDVDAIVFTVPTGTDDILFPDGAKAMFGADSDLQISHVNGTGSLIRQEGEGNLFIQGSDSIVFGAGDGSETLATFTDDGGCTLNFNNAAKIATASGGVTVTGEMAATTMDLSSNAVIDGTLTVGGALAKVAGKESIWIPSAAMYPSTTNPCSDLVQVETTALRPDMKVLDFAAAADDFAQFSIAFPKSWNEGTITFQPFWTVTGTNTGTVAWGLSGIAVSNDDSINTAFGTAAVTTALAFSGTSNDLMVSVESGAVTIAGSPAANDVCFFQVNRDVSADNQSGAARLIGIKVFFTTDAANDA